MFILKPESLHSNLQSMIRNVKQYELYKDTSLDELSGTINLNPERQRDYKWQKDRQCALIDTVLSGLFFPPLIFERNKETNHLDVFDGKQRLQTLLMFFENKFSYQSTLNRELNGKFFKDLPDSIKMHMKNYNIDYKIIEFPDEDIANLMYDRLNTKALKLNRQELRRNMYKNLNFYQLIRAYSSNRDIIEMYEKIFKKQINSSNQILVEEFITELTLSLFKDFTPNKRVSERVDLLLQGISNNSVSFNIVDLRNSLNKIKKLLSFLVEENIVLDNNFVAAKILLISTLAIEFELIQNAKADIKDLLLYVNNTDAIELKKQAAELISSTVISISGGQLHRAYKKLFDFKVENIKNDPRRKRVNVDLNKSILERDNYTCSCGSSYNLEIDHIIPYSKGGLTVEENLQVLCEKCNRSKSNKT